MNYKIIRLVLGAYQTNCYIVFDEDNNAVIIDPGDEANKIIETIDKKGFKPEKIIITHAHPDHFGAAKEVEKKYGVKIYTGEIEDKILEKRSSEIGNKLNADILLRQGDEVEFSGNAFKIIETPGHTPGGICLLLNNVLFSGDTLFRSSIGRTDFEGGDYDQIIDSLLKLMKLPEDTLVLPGHGPETTIGFEKENNPFINNLVW